MKLPSKVYDVLKWFCLVAMPALITLYGVIASTLGIPYTKEVLTIATAVNTCLGAMLGISNIQYNKNKEE